ncbi:MAG: hypothetical protein RSE13_10535 [Planktothrix sp. GU0601_MAG3]|nr:MAG: hypothetical protein RSE13_10535 [Planktothrix sp. GU0601_MAG3]
MNGTDQLIPFWGKELSSLSPLYFAQDNPLAIPTNINDLKLGQASLVDIAFACGILLVGYLIALFAQSLVKSLFKKTDLDNQIASWISGFHSTRR